MNKLCMKYTTLSFVFVMSMLLSPLGVSANHYDYDYYDDYRTEYYGGYGLNYSFYYGDPYYSYSRSSGQNYYQPSYQSQLEVNCYISPSLASIGQTVNWRASVSGGNNRNYQYSWSGSDGLRGYGDSVSFTYYTSGYKNAEVTVSSGGQIQTVACSNGVEVRGGGVSAYDYVPYYGASSYNAYSNYGSYYPYNTGYYGYSY